MKVKFKKDGEVIEKDLKPASEVDGLIKSYERGGWSLVDKIKSEKPKKEKKKKGKK